MTLLAPETLYEINGFKVTNTLITTIFVDFILLSLVFYINKHIKAVPGKIQSIAETIISYFYDLAESLAQDKAKVIFPWVTTFFIVILLTNLFGLLPGVGTFGFFRKEVSEHREGFIPLLRPATSDFNGTFALAFVSLIVTHILSIKYTGFKDYITRFISFNPIMLFVGLLEFVSEFIKMISLSFRLFGNIFAGEVVLHTISNLFAFVAPIPFMLLESIVAVVQALVFSMLTLVFMSLFIKPHHVEGGEH